MFELCLFDLDETLLHTNDLKELREACKGVNNNLLLKNIIGILESDDGRAIYSEAFLKEMRVYFPNLKLAVFTRSPRSYAQTVLKWLYPDFQWDLLICYDDVEKTKPHGLGIHKAMVYFDIKELNHVLMVGDSDVDIRAAYNAGCKAVLDKSGWPERYEYSHWKSLELIPDAIINNPTELMQYLESPECFLPNLECLIDYRNNKSTRYDKVNHFIPKSVGGDQTAYPIYVSGRSFANYDSLAYKRYVHLLTSSIEENKESINFPNSWIETIRTFIYERCSLILFKSNIIVTTIPHRPGRIPRLENLLIQLECSLSDSPIQNCNVTTINDLLSYKTGVRSQHGEHLNREERFMNVRDHLYVRNTIDLRSVNYVIVIDDVVTTGSSLIYASKYLKGSGATKVMCFAMAKNISDVL